eukprot:133488_1
MPKQKQRFGSIGIKKENVGVIVSKKDKIFAKTGCLISILKSLPDEGRLARFLHQRYKRPTQYLPLVILKGNMAQIEDATTRVLKALRNANGKRKAQKSRCIRGIYPSEEYKNQFKFAVISEQRTQPLRGVDNQNITPRNRNKLTKKRIKRAKNNPNNPYFKQKAWLSRNRNLEYFRETDNCVNKPKGKRKKRKTKDKDIYDW